MSEDDRDRSSPVPRAVEASGEITPPPVDIDEFKRRIWPARTWQDQALILQSRLEKLEAVAMNPDINVAVLRRELLGHDGTNGKVGRLGVDLRRELADEHRSIWGDEKPSAEGPSLARAARSSRRWATAFFAAGFGALAASAGLLIAAAVSKSHDTGALETQVRNNAEAIHQIEERLNRIPFFFSPTGGK